MGDTAGFLSMKAQFIPLSITFGSCGKRVGHFRFICFEKGEIFWKKIRKQAEATSKDWNNSEIKLPRVNRTCKLTPDVICRYFFNLFFFRDAFQAFICLYQ